jgi:UDP-N-acetylglucosamine 2-epimerase (non-hydrolysing)
MKVLTVLGTRPEIIRLSRVIPLLDQACEHVLVHTGQNFERSLSELFFDELGVREPDIHMGIRATSLADQIAQLMTHTEKILHEHRPDRLLILGDTNSGLSAIIARRMGIPVYHMEAGNRCYDDRVPEEVNRRIIDHSSSVLLPYTERSRQNLLREGISGRRIFVTGNPINEVMQHVQPRVESSTALDELGLAPQGYFLVTLHRAENVDVPERLARFLESFERLADEHGVPVIVSTHPRMRSRLGSVDDRGSGVRFCEPFGFTSFLRLERDARCILTDSGTVQEEACILRVPNLTLRDVTERPETVEVGANTIAGSDVDDILRLTRLALSVPPTWTPPVEYQATDVAATTARIVASYRHELISSE